MKGTFSIISGTACLFSLLVNSHGLAQGVLTWRDVQAYTQSRRINSLKPLVPLQIPADFIEGQFAISALHTGKTVYVVTKGDKRLANVSTVRQQIRKNISFNAVDAYPDLLTMPALSNFPSQLYNAGFLVEVSRYEARYDGVDTRSRAKQSRTKTLPNGKNVYYFQQDSGRRGWCTFENESAKYSRFVCVNIVNSSEAAFKILSAIKF